MKTWIWLWESTIISKDEKAARVLIEVMLVHMPACVKLNGVSGVQAFLSIILLFTVCDYIPVCH